MTLNIHLILKSNRSLESEDLRFVRNLYFISVSIHRGTETPCLLPISTPNSLPSSMIIGINLVGFLVLSLWSPSLQLSMATNIIHKLLNSLLCPFTKGLEVIFSSISVRRSGTVRDTRGIGYSPQLLNLCSPTKVVLLLKNQTEREKELTNRLQFLQCNVDRRRNEKTIELEVDTESWVQILTFGILNKRGDSVSDIASTSQTKRPKNQIDPIR